MTIRVYVTKQRCRFVLNRTKEAGCRATQAPSRRRQLGAVPLLLTGTPPHPPGPPAVSQVTISNDGATIMKLLDIVHPAAKTLVDIARSQDDEIGDGTTTVVITAGELLKASKQFIEDGVHPQVIIKVSCELQVHLGQLRVLRRRCRCAWWRCR